LVTARCSHGGSTMSSDTGDVRPVPAPISAPVSVSAPNTGPDPRTAYRLPDPDTSRDVQDLDPAPGANPDPGGVYTGDIRTTPASAGGTSVPGAAGSPIAAPDHPVDVRDLDPAPGTHSSGSGSGGIQLKSSGGGGGGGVQTTGFSGVDDPAALNCAGVNSNQLASLVHSGGDVGEDGDMLAAVGSLTGDMWGGDLGLALMHTLETWDKQARSLTRTCADIGDKCIRTAHNQTATESANASEMDAVRASLPDFG
jgi:hypothetical protein